MNDTILVSLITAVSTLLAGSGGQLVAVKREKGQLKRESLQREKARQLAAVGVFIEEAHKLRLESLDDSIPATYTAAVKNRVDELRVAESGKSRFRKIVADKGSGICWKGRPSRKRARREAESVIAQHEFAIDALKLDMGSARLRANLHSAWERMDMSLSDPVVREAAKNIQRVIRSSESYVGAPFTNPYTRGKGVSKYVPGQLDYAIDKLRDVSTRRLV